MNYEFERAFQKDFEKLKSQKLAEDIQKAINNVAKAETIKDIANIKKLTGYKTAYRIRCGSYRIGVIIENNTIIFTAFDHRGKIYKKFP